jgi:hypothetical protein
MRIIESLWITRLKARFEKAPLIFDELDSFKITFRKPNCHTDLNDE